MIAVMRVIHARTASPLRWRRVPTRLRGTGVVCRRAQLLPHTGRCVVSVGTDRQSQWKEYTERIGEVAAGRMPRRGLLIQSTRVLHNWTAHGAAERPTGTAVHPGGITALPATPSVRRAAAGPPPLRQGRVSRSAARSHSTAPLNLRPRHGAWSAVCPLRVPAERRSHAPAPVRRGRRRPPPPVCCWNTSMASPSSMDMVCGVSTSLTGSPSNRNRTACSDMFCRRHGCDSVTHDAVET